MTIAGTSWTAVDNDSVMNYCGSHGNASGPLSPDDIRGVIAAYGRRTHAPSMFFNSFEGTDADAWWFAGNGGVDRNIGYGRTGANNGWAANWTGWNAVNVNVCTGGARPSGARRGMGALRQRSDVEWRGCDSVGQ